MKYFRRIHEDLDTHPILAELEREREAFEAFTGRQDKLVVQRETQAIPIRGLRKSKIQGRKRRDVHESRYTTTSRRFPEVVAFLQGFAARVEADLGRAKIVTLPPGAQVYLHRDRGEYYRIRDRYHLVLQSPEGSPLTCGDEHVRMRERELWWFDNKEPHEAVNDSEVDRVHLIFDLLPLRDPKRATASGARARGGETSETPASAGG